MLFETPALQRGEQAVLDRIRGLWRDLRWRLRTKPYSWSGLLRRSTFARAIQGSNSIEGYRVSVDDAIAAADHDEPYEAGGDTWSAVTGYRDAMTYVLRLAEDPHFRYDASLIRSLHFMMLRYDTSKNPGTWRPGAVFVRAETTGEVVYEGPDAGLVPGLVEELVSRLDHPDSTSSMIQAAMGHLNLVMIHPFSDGNGRMARCLQTLILARSGVLDPAFCSVEEYLGRNTDSYYRVLADAGSGRWQPQRSARSWIRFMLTAHFRQASTYLRREEETGLVWQEVEEEIGRRGLPARAVPALVNAAFGQRIRNSSYRAHADVTPLVASRDLRSLVEAELLRARGERRGRFYVASDDLAALRGKYRRKKPIPDPFDEL